MAKISVMENKVPKKTVNLKVGAVSIGRSPDNDIHIKDSTVSSHHAKIVSYFDASYIEDLDSTNGTFVNGKRVQKHILKPGDVISVGTHTLKVEHEHGTGDVTGSFADKSESASHHRGLMH
ncbi:MAG: FHA domain-containing protein [Halobacteria archaeon]|nr:FHA domain-containing protein [Halobacteria archaeon]